MFRYCTLFGSVCLLCLQSDAKVQEVFNCSICIGSFQNSTAWPFPGTQAPRLLHVINDAENVFIVETSERERCLELVKIDSMAACSCHTLGPFWYSAGLARVDAVRNCMNLLPLFAPS